MPRDFTAGGMVLHDFCSIKNTVLDSESNGTGTELSDVLETIDKQDFVDPATGRAEIAPVFDCGSCLLPQADESIMRKVLSDRAELDARIYTFPSSMLKVNGEKINYARFLSDPSQDLKEALARIVPRIDLTRVDAFIGKVPYLTDLQRDFYRTYLAARFAALFAAGGR